MTNDQYNALLYKDKNITPVIYKCTECGNDRRITEFYKNTRDYVTKDGALHRYVNLNLTCGKCIQAGRLFHERRKEKFLGV